jgi:Ca2+-binding RTX toxin-like protein
MDMHRTFGLRQIGLAATAAVAVGLATTGSAGATPPTGSSSVGSDTLTVMGTSGADQLALRLAPGDPNTLQVDFGDDGSVDQSFSRSTFSRIDVFLLSGADRFRVDQSNGVFLDEAVTVDAGRGDDTVAGGDGNELVLGGSGNDTVDGNRGVDTAVLGSGQDIFIWDPGDGSDALEGGSGSDTLVFNGANLSEVMSLSANGSSSVFRRDPGGIRMDMQDVEQLDLAALGGADSITVDDLSATGFRQANIDLSVQGGGDGQADVVTVNGTEGADRITVQANGAQVDVDGLTTKSRLTGSETIDRLQVNTLGGNDTVDVGADATALIGIAVDLGSGQA